MSFDILNRWTQAILYRSEGATEIMQTLHEAVASGANLSGADLSRADLSGADLSGANLSGAYLSGAYFSGANLSGADLSGANLSGAYLSGANLSGADLSGADLSGANLSGADLSGTNFRGANLSRADLSGAYLSGATGITPVVLQIIGTRHSIIVREAGYITIGCEHHRLTWWENHYAAVGRREAYSADQVKEYCAHIAYCRQWMEQYGIAEVKNV